MVAIVPISAIPNPTANNIDVPAGMGGLSNQGALMPEDLRFVDCHRLIAPIGGRLSGEIMDRLQSMLLRTI